MNHHLVISVVGYLEMMAICPKNDSQITRQSLHAEHLTIGLDRRQEYQFLELEMSRVKCSVADNCLCIS